MNGLSGFLLVARPELQGTLFARVRSRALLRVTAGPVSNVRQKKKMKIKKPRLQQQLRYCRILNGDESGKIVTYVDYSRPIQEF